METIWQTGEDGEETVTPGLQGEWFIHYTTVAPIFPDVNLGVLRLLPESSQKLIIYSLVTRFALEI